MTGLETKEQLTRQLNEINEMLKDKIPYEDRVEWMREKLKISSKLDSNYHGWRNG